MGWPGGISAPEKSPFPGVEIPGFGFLQKHGLVKGVHKTLLIPTFRSPVFVGFVDGTQVRSSIICLLNRLQS